MDLNSIVRDLKCVGQDSYCVPQISYDAIKELKSKGKKIKKIYFISQKKTYLNSIFIFDDDSYYVASGFSIGHSGKVPRILYKLICELCPEKAPCDFETSEIPILDSYRNWIWKPDSGFLTI
jgi:hypothetical protein